VDGVWQRAAQPEHLQGQRPGQDHHAINTDRKARSHIRQLEALGFTVTLARAA
jgi:hypothetical protein